MSGTIVERRDQVLMTFFSRSRFIASPFFIRWSSTKGPFLSDLAIVLFRPALLRSPFDDELRRSLVAPRLVTLRRLTPRAHWMASARCLAFAAAQRVIDRVHRHAAVVRHFSEVTGAAGLADGDVLVL